VNIRLILLLALTGIAVGVSTILGLVHSGTEFLVWIGLALVFAYVIARGAPKRPFLHGFLTGFIGSMLATIVQCIFFDGYLETNPQAVMSFSQLPDGVYPQVAILVLSPITSSINGLFVGLLSWVASRFLARAQGPGPRPA
jgi:hypothetical protein